MTGSCCLVPVKNDELTPCPSTPPRDGKLSFEEFKDMVANTDIAKQMTLEEVF